MDEPDDDILTRNEGDVLYVTLNRPAVRNAQTPRMWQTLAHVAGTISAEARFVVLTGEGVDFSAGLDRTVLADTGPEGMIASLQVNPDEFIRSAQEAFRAWTRVPQTVIAAVQGNVIGAGFQLALASDLMFAAPGTRFALRETSIGLVPDLGGTGALIDALGYRRTFALCATGEFLSAEDAHAAGLVHRIAVDPLDAAREWMDQVRQIDVGAVADVKKLLRQVASDQNSWDIERSVQVTRLATLFGGARS